MSALRKLAWPVVLILVIAVGAILMMQQLSGTQDLRERPAAASTEAKATQQDENRATTGREQAEAAEAPAQQERDAAEAADDDIIRERFTDPDDATAFLDEHGGGACDWISDKTILCEYIPPQN